MLLFGWTEQEGLLRIEGWGRRILGAAEVHLLLLTWWFVFPKAITHLKQNAFLQTVEQTVPYGLRESPLFSSAFVCAWAGSSQCLRNACSWVIGIVPTVPKGAAEGNLLQLSHSSVTFHLSSRGGLFIGNWTSHTHEVHFQGWDAATKRTHLPFFYYVPRVLVLVAWQVVRTRLSQGWCMWLTSESSHRVCMLFWTPLCLFSFFGLWRESCDLTVFWTWFYSIEDNNTETQMPGKRTALCDT